MRLRLLLAMLLAPAALSSQDRMKSLPLAMPRLAPGVGHGTRIGGPEADSGMVAALPRTSLVGTATYAVETDTLDFRRKWTLRLRFAGPDSMEVVLRRADTLPPAGRTHDVLILASGISHVDSRYLAGDSKARDLGTWNRGFREHSRRKAVGSAPRSTLRRALRAKR